MSGFAAAGSIPEAKLSAAELALPRQRRGRPLGIELWSYLRDLFCLPPRWPRHQLSELAPRELDRHRRAR
jgi:hypothetical protein